MTIQDIIRKNEQAGKHFFNSPSSRYFRSRIGSNVYGNSHQGYYFITSELDGINPPRLYTIRKANDDGSIDTIGKFQQYRSLTAAGRAINELLK
jgi:hypothetical protein